MKPKYKNYETHKHTNTQTHKHTRFKFIFNAFILRMVFPNNKELCQLPQIGNTKNMKKIITLSSFLVIVFNSFAQRNTIDLSLNPRIWLNQYDLYNDNYMNDALQNRNAKQFLYF